jgi:predicted amidohydrolase
MGLDAMCNSRRYLGFKSASPLRGSGWRSGRPFREADGGLYNTAFLIDRNGKEAGRYHKTCPTWFECGARQRGSSFPVFPLAKLGTVGMLICYDLVFPETARCLALAGADIIFFPTMGMAAVGDDDIRSTLPRPRGPGFPGRLIDV